MLSIVTSPYVILNLDYTRAKQIGSRDWQTNERLGIRSRISREREREEKEEIEERERERYTSCLFYLYPRGCAPGPFAEAQISNSAILFALENVSIPESIHDRVESSRARRTFTLRRR